MRAITIKNNGQHPPATLFKVEPKVSPHVFSTVLTTEINATNWMMAEYDNIVDSHLFLILQIALDLNRETIFHNNNAMPMKPRKAITKAAHFV